jgi:hypothetical protein
MLLLNKEANELLTRSKVAVSLGAVDDLSVWIRNDAACGPILTIESN